MQNRQENYSLKSEWICVWLVFIRTAAGHENVKPTFCLENCPVKDKRTNLRDSSPLIVS